MCDRFSMNRNISTFHNFRIGEAFELVLMSDMGLNIAKRNKPDTPSNGGTIPVRKLFVNHVHENFSVEYLKRVFEEYGRVHDVSLPRDANQMRKHFIFVTYFKPEDAARALRNAKQFKNRFRFYIHPADQWHQPVELPSGQIQWYRGRIKDLEETPESNSPDTMTSVEEAEFEGHSINMLNDDCLVHIFSYLSKSQWIGIERVCRRWRDLSLGMWNQITTLDFNKVFIVPPKSPLRNDHLRELLLRCGDQITSLDISAKSYEIHPDRALPLIAKLCSKLTDLNLSNLPPTPRLNILFEHLGQRLTSVTFNGAKEFGDMAMCGVLRWAVNLQYLSVVRTEIQGYSWSLPANLKTLIVDDCFELRQPMLNDTLRDVTTLKKLSIGKVSFKPDSLGTVAPHLSSLSMKGGFFPGRRIAGHVSLPNLPLLLELDIPCSSFVNNSVLYAIVNTYPELVKLNITGCGAGCGSSENREKSVTDSGIMALTRLKKLTWLGMGMLNHVTSASLEHWAMCAKNRLTTLVCPALPALTDDGVCRLLAASNGLTLLDLSYNRLLTDRVLEVAHEVVTQRPIKKPLTIHVHKTALSLETAPKHDRLHLLDDNWEDISALLHTRLPGIPGFLQRFENDDDDDEYDEFDDFDDLSDEEDDLEAELDEAEVFLEELAFGGLPMGELWDEWFDDHQIRHLWESDSEDSEEW